MGSGGAITSACGGAGSTFAGPPNPWIVFAGSVFGASVFAGSVFGVATVRHYLEAGAIDAMHLAIAPVVLGTGEHFWSGLDVHAMGFRVQEHVAGEGATHVVLRR